MSNWRAKDAAIYLVTALTVKRSATSVGATATNQLVNIVDFFNNFLLVDLQSDSRQPVALLKADAIKFVNTFRNQVGFV